MSIQSLSQLIEISVSGSQALAYGAAQAGVNLVTGYPGSPVTAAFEAFAKLADDPNRTFWAINEKSAADLALGVSLAGGRALLCVKSPGFNVALDTLMVANLAPGDGGLVILAGDDPGGWGSQSEEDTRPLVQALEIPMLEPATVQAAYSLLLRAFELSEKYNLPVVLRVIHALTVDQGVIKVPAGLPPAVKPSPFARRKDRWTVLPVQVVPLHQKLQQKMCAAAGELAAWPQPCQSGSLRRGVIAAGYAWSKLDSVLKNGEELALPVLGLEVLNPLPAGRIAEFVAGLDEVLVIEETAPVIETAVRSIAQQKHLPVSISGRMTGHLPGAGELDKTAIASALRRLLPDWPGPRLQPEPRSMISRKSLCEGCPYIPVYDALKELMDQHGGRDRYVVTGETGCLVRGQLPPWEMLDVKYSMGSSIGIASGMQRAGIPHRPVVLSGDSAFLHNGFGELIDAVRSGRDLLVIILDNNVTALTGGQPHPATQQEGTRGPSTQVNLESLIRAAGVEWLRLVDPRDEVQLNTALEEGLQAAGVRVVISRSPCVLYQA